MGYEGSFIPIKFIRLDYLVFAIDNHAMELDWPRDINEEKIIRLNTHHCWFVLRSGGDE